MKNKSELQQQDFDVRQEPHTVIDMGYLVYYYVMHQDYYYDNVNNLFFACEGYVLANESKYSLRKEQYPEYKENRKGNKHIELHQKAKAFWKELNNNQAFHTIQYNGLEGDDICALLAIKNGLTIISHDKDYLQLPNISLKKLDGTDNSVNVNKLPKTLQHINFDKYSDKWLLYLVIDGDIADNVPRLRDKGKKGLEELAMILESNNSWDMAYKIYQQALLDNLMLILLPHPSTLRLSVNLTDKQIFELVANNQYINYVKKYGIELL